MPDVAHEIRVRGRVQGVGFRPFVWRLARRFGLDGHVFNDAGGVFILARGPVEAFSGFLSSLKAEAPPLAAVMAVEVRESQHRPPSGFFITQSEGGPICTEISPDFATCDACRAETLERGQRREGYAFTNCTHCGPRLSIIRALPYDRPKTTMADFPLCADCAAEYANPEDRRFHAEPIACPACGPRLVLARWASPLTVAQPPIPGAQEALRAGEIVAVKALGGYQLCVDATNAEAVARLRRAKQRDGKPFALMARDVAMVMAHAEVSPLAARALTAREAPIVLLPALKQHGLAPDVAPGLETLGFMLPSTPLHILLLAGLAHPVVMTSGNLSGDPQITDDAEAKEKLGTLAGFALTHDRAIANRIDDSVAREMGGALRLVRRARGYAPASLPLPPGLEGAPDVVAYGADLKSTFCLISGGQVILSGHQGDLESAAAITDFSTNLGLYSTLYAHAPSVAAVDLHEGYAATRLGRAASEAAGITLESVQHHHAHLASVMGENGIPAGEDVIGIVLDGLGLGDDGTLWGAEVLLGSYGQAHRVAGLSPTPLPGGDAASREPWRNLYAALGAHIGWDSLRETPVGREVLSKFEGKPLGLIDKLIRSGVNAPLSSSCGRLFDAVAAALGCGFERQRFEGEAALTLETLCGGVAAEKGYAFGVSETVDGLVLDPAPFWRALLDDLGAGRPRAEMARDFHAGLMDGLCTLVARVAGRFPARPKVALSGGCFQNRVLFEGMLARLEASGFTVLTHAALPANDGGIAFGQALVAASRHLAHHPE